MVEGVFAGYKLSHDARWRGEYLVYDRTSYENWNGKYELPIHVTKELYIPGGYADSRDLHKTFRFPVEDGGWKSQAPSMNRYVRRYKRKAPTDNETSGRTTSLGHLQVSESDNLPDDPLNKFDEPMQQ